MKGLLLTLEFPDSKFDAIFIKFYHIKSIPGWIPIINNFHFKGVALRGKLLQSSIHHSNINSNVLCVCKEFRKESPKIYTSAENLILWSQCYLSYLYQIVSN